MRRRVPVLAVLSLLGGCAVSPAPLPLTAPPAPVSASVPSAADAALGRDAALAAVARLDGRIPTPVIVHAAEAEGGAADVATLSIPDAVLFDFGMSAPREGSAAVLDALARAILSSPPPTVATVAGNTDAVGSDDFNQALSEARARNVVVALAGRGVDPARLRAIGFGRHRPVADNATAAGRALNRRVEVALSGSFDANRDALARLAPVEAAVGNAPATAPGVSPDAGPAGATAAAAPIAVRRPAPLAIHANRPAAVRPNALGPSVPY